MTETSQRSGRRRLKFHSYEDVLADVRQLAALETRALGSWSLGQVCNHLAKAMDKCINGTQGFPVPLKTRILARIFRNRVLSGRLPSGFKLPPEGAALLPEPMAPADGIAALEQAIVELSKNSRRVPHPVFGKLNVAQWDQFHLRHAELHLSFIVPQAPATSGAPSADVTSS